MDILLILLSCLTLVAIVTVIYLLIKIKKGSQLSSSQQLEVELNKLKESLLIDEEKRSRDLSTSIQSDIKLLGEMVGANN